MVKRRKVNQKECLTSAESSKKRRRSKSKDHNDVPDEKNEIEDIQKNVDEEHFSKNFNRKANLTTKRVYYDAIADKKLLADWNRIKDKQILEIMTKRALRAGSVGVYYCVHEEHMTVITTDESTRKCLEPHEKSQGRIINALRTQLCRFPANMQHPDHARHTNSQKEKVSLGSLQDEVTFEIKSKGQFEIAHLGSVASSIRMLPKDTMLQMIFCSRNPYFILGKNESYKVQNLQSILKCILVTLTPDQLCAALMQVSGESQKNSINAEVVKWSRLHEVTDINEPVTYDFYSESSDEDSD